MNPDLEIKTLHEDAAFVVVEKPSGMLSVRGRGPKKEDCVAARVWALFLNGLKNRQRHECGLPILVERIMKF